jgi:MFS transporter, putative metabolite:H+ symporter
MKKIINILVVIAALGYFVDIYDLVLFSIVRVPSLRSMGLSPSEIFSDGMMLLNIQMLGMLIGGIFWGVLGDRKGRLSVLFGSILMYSVANLANAFVHSIEAYAFWRFIAGIGLAGELGAGITLVAETLPKDKRGWGTMIVASFGICGAILAGFVADIFDWRTAYIIGGVLGLALLFLRIGAYESGIYKDLKPTVSRGNFFALFSSRSRFSRYLKCILIGLPTWYVIGILVTFSPEFAELLHVQGEVSAGTAIMMAYGGLVVGDIMSGTLSQFLRSRRKTVLIFLILTVFSVFGYFMATGVTATAFYAICFGLGIAVGYWAIFVTIAAEQFGTNLRSTVATTVPNFIRASVIPLTFGFVFLKNTLGPLNSALVIGAISLGLALIALYFLEETFSKDMDYIETI